MEFGAGAVGADSRQEGRPDVARGRFHLGTGPYLCAGVPSHRNRWCALELHWREAYCSRRFYIRKHAQRPAKQPRSDAARVVRQIPCCSMSSRNTLARYPCPAVFQVRDDQANLQRTFLRSARDSRLEVFHQFLAWVGSLGAFGDHVGIEVRRRLGHRTVVTL